jgi:hypothetical protein
MSVGVLCRLLGSSPRVHSAKMMWPVSLWSSASHLRPFRSSASHLRPLGSFGQDALLTRALPPGLQLSGSFGRNGVRRTRTARVRSAKNDAADLRLSCVAHASHMRLLGSFGQNVLPDPPRLPVCGPWVRLARMAVRRSALLGFEWPKWYPPDRTPRVRLAKNLPLACPRYHAQVLPARCERSGLSTRLWRCRHGVPATRLAVAIAGS